MIIGIAGTLGAGKGTVVDYLVKNKDFSHYSAREFLWQEVDRRGLPRVRDHLSLVANDLRAKHHAGHIVEQLFAEAQKAGTNAVIESLHTEAEADFLRKHGAIILGVDADIPVRFKRIQGRGSETDRVSFEKFVEDNEREIASQDPAKHNIQNVINGADYRLHNNGTLEDLYAQIEVVLQKLTK